jgi:hypothetical protein
MVQEISANDECPNICYNECQVESASKAKVKGEQSSAVCSYGCMVDC